MYSCRNVIWSSAVSHLLAQSGVNAAAVFCHYMIGTLTAGSGHAEQDIANAQAMGFDAFALNVQAPTADFTQSTVSQLFTYAASTGFKLFFSLDMSADNTLSDYTSLLQQYLGNEAYYTAGPQNYPFLSTFDSGNLEPSDWSNFKSSFANELYFVPDFDDTAGYYTDTNDWFSTWDSVVDGVFSWETAWPAQQDIPTNVSTDSDQYVQNGSNGKAYMIGRSFSQAFRVYRPTNCHAGLSSLQYKRLPNESTHYYRVGEVNLPERMVEILELGKASNSISPEFVEVITWNDAGESHYIGNLWPEGIPDFELEYANQTSWSHTGWQSLVTSFIAAYKAGGDATTMAPQSGTSAVGAMWYRTILKDASCVSDSLGKPSGWQAAQDAVNYAIVLPSDTAGMSIRISSNGNVLQTVPGVQGLNYGCVGGMTTGPQLLDLLDSSGDVIMTAASVEDVTADTTTGICNFNYQVAPLN